MNLLSRWGIVEGGSGRLCIVPENMVDEHLTYGRETLIWKECDGLLEAIEKLKKYEKSTKDGE